MKSQRPSGVPLVLEAWEFADPAYVAERRELNGLAADARAHAAARERDEIQRTRDRMRELVFGKARELHR